MRPGPGQAAASRRHLPGDNEAGIASQPERPQMSFFLADEATVDAALQHESFIPPPTSRRNRKPISKELAGESSRARFVTPVLPLDIKSTGSRTTSSGSADDLLRCDQEPSSRPDTPAGHASTLSMQSLLLGQSGAPSTSSFTSSRRGSVVESSSECMGSQVLPALESQTHPESGTEMMDSGSAPQLVMPSIKMPSRRPFTPEGKCIGRLKLLVAGSSGVGKTSLIKAIVQSCEHIVHVDPINSPATAVSTIRARPRRQSLQVDHGTAQITEIYASTKPYPEWWSDLDDMQVLRRRKSLGDTVLDRNICFVDTPGLNRTSSAVEAMERITSYVHSHLDRVYSDTLPESELLNMLGGEGGAQVDAVLFIVTQDLQPAEIRCLQALSSLTNIIPIIGRADELSEAELITRKDRTIRQLREASISTFAFSINSTRGHVAAAEPLLYSVSSAVASDHETMDASLLMSPEYVQPLMPSQLPTLVGKVFSHEGAAWLRYAAARKYVQWRRTEKASKPMDLYRPIQAPRMSGGGLVPRIQTPTFGAPTSFALARITDHTQREERLAQVQLANWAADLQNSLAKERRRYAALAEAERQSWLEEQLVQCEDGASLIPLSQARRCSSSGSERSGRALRRRTSHSEKAEAHQDPLGLLELIADLRGKGRVALEVLGGLGVIGGLALWISKHYMHLQVSEWAAGEWSKICSGTR